MKKITIIIAIYIIGICSLFSAQPQLDMTLTLFQNRQDMSIIYGVTALSVPYPMLIDSDGNIGVNSDINGQTVEIYGEDINSDKRVLRVNTDGSINNYLQDQTTNLVDLLVTTSINGITLEANATVNGVSLEFTTGSSVELNDVINLKQDTHFYQGKVVYKCALSEEVMMDSPIDYQFMTTEAYGNRGTQNMNVNGSSTTAVYIIKPPTASTWDITRILIMIRDQTVMDTSKFGGISALTRGVVIRKKINGTYHNLFNMKSNGGIAQRMYDLYYTDKAPSGYYGLYCRRTFGCQDKNGVVIRLNGSTGEQLEVLIQDDLSDLDNFHIVCQGHETED